MNSALILGILFSSSFLSATLLPGNSEAVLTGLLITQSISPLLMVVVALAGNTLGGLVNVVIGRFLPHLKKPGKGVMTATKWLKRYGAPALLLSWLPVVGDVLCIVAGWLRLPWFFVIFYMTVGKAVRYNVLAVIVLKGFPQ